MGLSPDAALFALRLVEQRCIPPALAAELLGEVAAGRGPGGELPDQLIALQERLLAREPSLAERVMRLGGEASYVPVDCRGCRARFRVLPEEVGPSALCPLCGEPIMAAGSLRFALPYTYDGLVAAEEGPVYKLKGEGRRFAHFRLLELLGSGGAGKVYEAQNLKTNRGVAVKLLDFQPLEPASEAFKQLRREVRAATMVADEHVVQVFDLGIAEGVPFMEMELVRGDSLRELVRREGPLPAAQACSLCVQALCGLDAVHRARIVHRDIKPQNILIDQEGRARLTDFGLARFLEETTSISTRGRVVGSPHFMAPEQWRGEKLTAATDLYAMGLVLYFALTGKLPYEGEPQVALMYKHLHQPVIEPGQVLYQVPDYLAQVIRRATEKTPSARFADAPEFIAALQWFLDGRAP